jgi:hypothetical protein
LLEKLVNTLNNGEQNLTKRSSENQNWMEPYEKGLPRNQFVKKKSNQNYNIEVERNK